MKSITTFLSLGLVALSVISCSENSKSGKSQSSEDILVNQIGYPTTANKKALVKIDSDEFVLNTLDGKSVFKGKTDQPRSWELAGDTVRIADFSEFSEKGQYILCVK